MVAKKAPIPVKPVAWLPCWRIIPSRFPPVDLLERVANADEFDIIYEIEQLTNPRIRTEVGEIDLVPREERMYGPGTSLIMAAFTHLPTYFSGSRFTDGSYGVFYAGNSLETAIAETKYHREKFLSYSKLPKIEVDMRVLLTDLKASLHDIVGQKKERRSIYDPENYSDAQKLGTALRGNGLSSYGIRYSSVRYQDGQCVAIFRPSALKNCRQERHLCYVWNGEKITHVYRKQMEPQV
jgi:hypothetical protein